MEVFQDNFIANLSNTSRPMYNEMEEIDEFDFDRQQVEQIVEIVVPICFGMIGIVGLIGNFLVVIVVAANPGMRSTTNILIINLAVADLLFVIFCIPFTTTDFVLPYWPFGNVWCKIVQYLIIVTAFASVYTLVLMSLDRYLAVVHPISSMSWRTENHAILAICIAWAVIFTISTPALVIHGEIILVVKSLEVYPLTTATIVIQIASHILSYMNSCVNPILYAFLSDSFRKAFRKIIYCRPRPDQNKQLGPLTKTTRAASTGDVL
ncbi:allatostatin A receptor 1 isoform X2 [Megachile rotundata]|uniref:allatostatin A receptor 1 isoform X2 n=1 Tax=Megachile rotundata TaxID=143995 RepID=UPI003FCF9FD8